MDTSVWSEALRRARRSASERVRELHSLILEHRVDIIGPVRQEVLSGIRHEAQFEALKRHLAAFPDIPLETEDFVEAAKFFNACRAKGVQGSNTDFLICAVAARRQISVFTADRDFKRFALHLPVVLHEARAAGQTAG